MLSHTTIQWRALVIGIAVAGCIATSLCIYYTPMLSRSLATVFYGRTEICAVKGQVLVNGEPAENVNVAFHPVQWHAIDVCPVGLTNRNGIFSLATNSAFAGASPGEYDVTFVWPVSDSGIDECECNDPSELDRLKGFYSRRDIGFRVLVEERANEFTFSLWLPR